jgi:protocatechuate 3,4-dioxygenase beta subunit
LALACEVFVNLRLLPFVFTLIAGVGLAQSPTTDSTAALTVQGRVLQDPGGQPIRKVDVQLQLRNQPSESRTATTDAEGKFQMDEVKPGTYRVILDHSGFLQPRGRMGTTLTLTSPQSSHGIVLHMKVAATIYGKILDSDGDPIPNVSVHAVPAGAGGTFAARSQGFGNTNDLGEYRIPNLRPGKYLVSADARGRKGVSLSNTPEGTTQTHLEYVPTYYPDVLDKEHAAPVEVHSGDELPLNITPLTSPAFFIRGTVTKPPGAGFAQVMLRSNDGDQQQNSQTGEGGEFSFQDLRPGTYTAYLMVIDLKSIADLQQNRQSQMPNVQFMRLGPPLVITNANLDGLHLVPEPGGRVRGRFRMDKPSKMDWTQLGAILTGTDSSEFTGGNFAGRPSITRVQSDGSFDFANVGAGDYRLAITAGSNNLQDYYTKSINLDGKDVADTGFSVSGGSYSLDVVVSAEGATIEGTVVDAKGKPVADAAVVASPNGERRNRLDIWGQDTSDAQGHFRLRGLISGDYTVLAWEDPEANVRNAEFVTSYQDRGEKIQLEDGANKTVSVKVIAASDDDP